MSSSRASRTYSSRELTTSSSEVSLSHTLLNKCHCCFNFSAELHSFLLERHRETFALFYQEFTGSEMPTGPPTLHKGHGRSLHH